MFLRNSVFAILMFSSCTAVAGAPSVDAVAAARKQVAAWHQDRLKTEARMLDALERHDAGELFKIDKELTAWNMENGANPLWRDRDASSPYIPCNTAWIDMALLSSAVGNLIAKPDEANDKIVTQELADYNRSKALCDARLVMAPADALAESSND